MKLYRFKIEIEEIHRMRTSICSSFLLSSTRILVKIIRTIVQVSKNILHVRIARRTRSLGIDIHDYIEKVRI